MVRGRTWLAAAAITGAAAAGPAARAEVITYTLSASATITGYGNAEPGSITLSGQFAYDTVSEEVISSNVVLSGDIVDISGNNPVTVSDDFTDVLTGGSDTDQLYVGDPNSSDALNLYFSNDLADDAADPLFDQCGNAGCFFWDANPPDGYENAWHIGYADFSGEADPAPEPASLFLLGGSLLGLAAARRRLAGAILRA